ncbi:Shikimate o-hydroxycinnamoyltransferase [Globisporangium polare]
MTPTTSASDDHAVLLPLSPMDAIMGSFGFTILYIFPRSNTNALPFDLERLHSSFQALVENEYRVLLGELHVHPTTGVASVKQTPNAMNASAIPFEKTALQDVTTDDAMASLSSKFMPKREPTQLLTLKATLLSDGGLAIGVNMSHTLLDGEGMFTFMKVWGEFYRGVPEQDRTTVCHDRSLLFGKGAGPVLPHPEFKLKQAAAPAPEPVMAPAASAPPVFPTTTQHVFHISPEQMKQIKAVAMGTLSENDDGYISTTDALTALFIILITQARGHGKDVKFTTGVNARKRFSPPLPANYAGNVISNAFSSYEAHELETLSTTAIGNIAKRVRQSILLRDETFLRDAIEFLTSQDNLSDVLVGTDFFLGPDLMFTSWTNFGMYDADFGAHPWYVGVPRLPICDGMMIFMEGIRGAEGLDLVVLLEVSAMKRLLELWECVPFWSTQRAEL